MIHKADTMNDNTFYNLIHSNGRIPNKDLAKRLNEVEKALFQPIPQTGETWAAIVPYFSQFPIAVKIGTDGVYYKVSWIPKTEVKAFLRKIEKPQKGEVWLCEIYGSQMRGLIQDMGTIVYTIGQATYTVKCPNIKYIRKIK